MAIQFLELILINFIVVLNFSSFLISVCGPLLQASRKRKAPGSVIGQVLNLEEEEDDLPASYGKKVASTVKPQRK